MTADRILFLVFDGVSDRPCPDLSGITPLQAARTPVLDQIVTEGCSGIMDTIAPGIRPGSDTAHLSLLGYPPGQYYTGRGPLEAEGSGIRMEPGMVGFRCNYATLAPDGKVRDRRAGRIHETTTLSKAIQERVDLTKLGVEFYFRSGAGHRAALALRGDGLGDRVSSNDPKKDGMPMSPFSALTEEPEDQKTATVLNEFVRQSTEVLSGHPLNLDRKARGLPVANVVLIRGAGKMGNFEPFSKRFGLNGGVISAAALITGIGRVIGLTPVNVPGITGSADTDVEAKVSAAIESLKRLEFVLVNIKGADEAGHDGQATEKMRFIERVDRALEPLLGLTGCLVVICSDHSTPCTVKDHSADPVPLVIRGPGVRVDRTCRFDEVSCADGALHRIRGSDLMPILLDLINRAHKYGA